MEIIFFKWKSHLFFDLIVPSSKIHTEHQKLDLQIETEMKTDDESKTDAVATSFGALLLLNLFGFVWGRSSPSVV